MNLLVFLLGIFTFCGGVGTESIPMGIMGVIAMGFATIKSGRTCN